MLTNDYLKSLRYILDANDTRMLEICKLGGIEISQKDMYRFLLDEEHEQYLACSDKIAAHFLNGLVIFKRGKDDNRAPAPLEIPVTNNLVLKKIRVAFELKEEDLLALIAASGLQFGKSELSAFMRKKDHRNYRECGDQVLRNLLRVLADKIRGSGIS